MENIRDLIQNPRFLHHPFFYFFEQVCRIYFILKDFISQSKLFLNFNIRKKNKKMLKILNINKNAKSEQSEII
ncbi:MAG: hypothetical protein A2161_05745 [Candidatus Schekmanbacteria bacterium RBG_13_48_7]|uniref:Uncharacterized protein n=1 Tax=Candidatus Schekmanbacteria bacterium RBG_13_48_7 TaxID=1817878 RepID=A0A1F7RPZ2_9BACT|nr:MAG: hypothetical protein A2161_05745 [Candidatus Schekmanbacteria bacterium RBG_13_48_7]